MTIPSRAGAWPAAALLLGLIPALCLADQIVMKNGDRVTGDIVKQDGKTITIKTALFGVVAAPWDQVASIESQKPLNVVLQDGRSVQGALSTAGGNVRIAAATGSVEVPASAVTALRNGDEQRTFERLSKPGILQLWTGSGTLGFAGANGNAKTLTFTTGLNAARATRTDKTMAYFSLIKASAQANGKTSDTAQAVRGGWAYDRNIRSRFFIDTFNDYEYDRFQNLDLRFVAGGGFGWKAVKREHASLSLVGGADYIHSSFSTPLTRSSAEVYWGDDYSLKINGAVAFVQSFRMFNDLKDTAAYRMNADAGISTKLKKWLTWNVSLSDRFLSTPAPGRKRNDWMYMTGVGVTFAR
jgi:hypothetical protein